MAPPKFFTVGDSPTIEVQGFNADGTPYTAGVFNTATIVAEYRLDGTNNWVTITLVTQTVNGAYASGGFVKLEEELYRLDLPTAAAVAANGGWVKIKGISGVFFPAVRFEVMAGSFRAATFQADIVAVDGDTTAKTNLKLMFNGTGYAGGTIKLGVNLLQLLGTAFTESSAGRLVAGIKKYFDVATPTGTINDLPGIAPGSAGGVAIVGSQMTLTTAAETSLANEVERQIIDETDSEKVLKAMTDKIASVNPSLAGLTLGAIASQVRTELTAELARIDATISSRSTLGGVAQTADNNVALVALDLKLLHYVMLILRGDAFVYADLISTLNAINANTGSGVGTYDPRIRSLQANPSASGADTHARTLAALNGLQQDADSLTLGTGEAFTLGRSSTPLNAPLTMDAEA